MSRSHTEAHSATEQDIHLRKLLVGIAVSFRARILTQMRYRFPFTKDGAFAKMEVPWQVKQLSTAIAAVRETHMVLLNYKKNGEPFWNLL